MIAPAIKYTLPKPLPSRIYRKNEKCFSLICTNSGSISGEAAGGLQGGRICSKRPLAPASLVHFLPEQEMNAPGRDRNFVFVLSYQMIAAILFHNL